MLPERREAERDKNGKEKVPADAGTKNGFKPFCLLQQLILKLFWQRCSCGKHPLTVPLKFQL